MDLSELNAQQSDAVTETLDVNAVLIAGAGSGKTRVLIKRIGYLIEDIGVLPENIMGVTFTNKAAQELIDRISGINPDVDKMWVGTFHSICVRILKQFGSEINIYKFTILDQYDAKSTLKEVMNKMGLNTEKANLNRFFSKISGCKSNLINPSTLMKQYKSDNDLEFAQAYKAYQDIKWKRKSFDFDDLIIYTTVLLTRSADTRRWFWDNVTYIMCDESQDTNVAQYKLLELIVGPNNLFMVGDDSQSIYSFRHAKPENLINFERKYPGAKIMRLEQNYRSTQTIVNASNDVISNNIVGYKKTCFSNGAVGDPVLCHTSNTGSDEADWIASEIKLLNTQGVDYRDIAILYRTNSQSRAIEESFIKKGIPHELIGGLKFYDRKEIKDVLAFLRLKANNHDEVSFKRAVGCMQHFGKKAVSDLVDYVNLGNSNFVAVFEEFIAPKRLQYGLVTLTHLYRMGSDVPSEFIKEVVDQTGYMAELILEDTPDSKARIENIEELIKIAKESEDLQPGLTIEDFINKISLASVADKNVKSVTGNVTLMTVHSSKGLEYKIVFIIGTEEGLLPHGNSMGSLSAIEEERRLMYVAMTRAKELLYITNAVTRRDISGNVSMNKPSRFIKEISAKYLYVI